jgi:hypothetical protein
MKAVVVYEASFPGTRAVAEAVAFGVGRSVNVSLLRSDETNGLRLDDVDLLVVGGPAQLTRAIVPGPSVPGASSDAAGARGVLSWPGIHQWLASVGQVPLSAAAFDTRIYGRTVFARRISKATARDLAQHGMSLVVPPSSFRLDETGQLALIEARRAEAWGANLGGVLRTRRAAG